MIGFVIFTFIILMGKTFQLTEMVMNKGLSIIYIIRLFGMMLPNFLVFTIPMSFVLSIILTFSRTSRDYEIVALKASGVNLYQLVRPVFLLAIFFYLFTSFLMIYIAPKSNFNLNKFIVQILKAKINVALEEEVFNSMGDFVIYVDEIPFRGDRLYGLLIYDDRNLEKPLTIIAREGYIYADESDSYFTISLRDGNIFLAGKYEESDRRTEFETYTLNIDIFDTMEDSEGRVVKKSWEMTLDELRTAIYDLKISLESFKARYEKDPTEDNRFLVEDTKKQIRKREVEISKMFAIPAACIIFLFIGIPMGIQTNPKGRSGSLMLAIIVIFLYYVFMALGEVLGKKGYLPPLYSMWLGNIVLGGVGLYMFIKTGRESPVYIITLYNNIADTINRIISKIK